MKKKREPICSVASVLEKTSSGFYWLELPNGYRARGYAGRGMKEEFQPSNQVNVEFSPYDMSQARILGPLP